MIRSNRLVWLAVLLGVSMLAAPTSALEFNNGGSYAGFRHDRFVPGTFPTAPVPNPSFFLAPYGDALAGMGWDATGPAKKIALISPRHFLNADHYQAYSQVSFLDAGGVLRTFTIENNVAVTGDIAIGTLTEAIPPEYGIDHFAIAAVEDSEYNGREVVYVANAPGSERFAAGLTGLAFTLTTTGKFDSNLVAPERAMDRAYGILGDSGGPTFLEEDGELVLLGHHYSGTYDQLIGLPNARNAADDHMAADGYLLDVHGEGRAGDPQAGDVVVSRLAPDLRLPLDEGSGAERVHEIRIYDFSYAGVTVNASVTGAGMALRVPGSSDLLTALALGAPADGSGVALEVVFDTSAAATPSGSLQVSAGASSHTIPLGDAPVALTPVKPSVQVNPIIRFGNAGAGGSPGTPQTFPIHITNHDPAGQPDATFVLSTSCPIALGIGCAGGWAIDFDADEVTLAPGETTIVDVHATPPSGAIEVLYVFPLAAERPAASAFGGGAAFLYLITGTDDPPEEQPEPPAPPTGLTVLDSSGGGNPTLTLGWDASTDPDVVSYELVRDGAVVSATSSTSYLDGDINRNTTYEFSVRAVDSDDLVSSDSASIFVRNGNIETP